MNLQPITLEHRRRLIGLKDRTDTMFADNSFAYIYLHRDIYYFSICLDPIPFVKGKTFDGLCYVMPLAAITKENIGPLIDTACSCGAVFPVHEKYLPLFSGMGLKVVSERGDSDYIYSIDKLKFYAGKKLHGQRNLLSQFKKNYSYEMTVFSPDKKSLAMDILDQWQSNNSTPREETDYYPCAEALELADELGLTGYLFYVDGRAAGFIIGEVINGDTFTAFFAKGLRGIKGIYQFMNNSAALAMPDTVKYFNFQQDMNIEGLRKAKLSYDPDIILSKYRVLI